MFVSHKNSEKYEEKDSSLRCRLASGGVCVFGACYALPQFVHDLRRRFTRSGISEAMNPAEEEWGEDAMLAELKNVYDKPSEEILNHIILCADKFANGAKQHDDMTMIIVKII
jgi:hypothetical protein